MILERMAVKAARKPAALKRLHFKGNGRKKVSMLLKQNIFSKNTLFFPIFYRTENKILVKPLEKKWEEIWEESVLLTEF